MQQVQSPPCPYCTGCGGHVYAEYTEDGVLWKCASCGATIGEDGEAVLGTAERREPRGPLD